MLCVIERQLILFFILQNGISDESDSECPASPLRPVRPRRSLLATSQEFPPNADAGSVPSSAREHAREPSATSVFEREEYQSAIRGLGSAKARLKGLSQPQLSSTANVSSNGASALVPEEEYLAGDWLEDDLGEIRPKKKRRIHLEQNGIRGEDVSSSSAARGHNRSTNSDVVSRGIFGFYLCLSFTKEVN